MTSSRNDKDSQYCPNVQSNLDFHSTEMSTNKQYATRLGSPSPNKFHQDKYPTSWSGNVYPSADDNNVKTIVPNKTSKCGGSDKTMHMGTFYTGNENYKSTPGNYISNQRNKDTNKTLAYAYNNNNNNNNSNNNNNNSNNNNQRTYSKNPNNSISQSIKQNDIIMNQRQRGTGLDNNQYTEMNNNIYDKQNKLASDAPRNYTEIHNNASVKIGNKHIIDNSDFNPKETTMNNVKNSIRIPHSFDNKFPRNDSNNSRYLKQNNPTEIKNAAYTADNDMNSYQYYTKKANVKANNTHNFYPNNPVNISHNSSDAYGNAMQNISNSKLKNVSEIEHIEKHIERNKAHETIGMGIGINHNLNVNLIRKDEDKNETKTKTETETETETGSGIDNKYKPKNNENILLENINFEENGKTDLLLSEDVKKNTDLKTVIANDKNKLPHVCPKDLNDNIMNEDGALKMFKNFIVVDKYGGLKKWNGFEWERMENSFTFFLKARYDNKGIIWCINDSYEVLKFIKGKFKNMGKIGNEELIDIHFDHKNTLWGINRKGHLLKWNKTSWLKISYYGFHKLISIAFDKNGVLWAINSKRSIASWNSEKKNWDEKNTNSNINMLSMDFDEHNMLWVVTTSGVLFSYCSEKWVNHGNISIDHLISVSFKKSIM